MANDFIKKITECEYLEFCASKDYADYVTKDLESFVTGKSNDVNILKDFEKTFLNQLSCNVFSYNLISAGYDNYHYDPLECQIRTGLIDDFYVLFKDFLKNKTINCGLKLAYSYRYQYSEPFLANFTLTGPMLLSENSIRRSHLVYLSQYDKYDYLFKDSNACKESCLCSYFYNIEACLKCSLGINFELDRKIKSASKKLKKMFRAYLLCNANKTSS